MHFYFPHQHKMWGKVLFSCKKGCLSVTVISQKLPIGFSLNFYCECISVVGWLSSNPQPIQNQVCQKYTKISDFGCCFIVVISGKKIKKIILSKLIIEFYGLMLKQKKIKIELPEFWCFMLFWFLVFFITIRFIWLICH